MEQNQVFKVVKSFKGWPVEEAGSLEEASHMIFGSPYWEIPEDTYTIIDKNETFSILAVYKNGRPSYRTRYMAVNMNLSDSVDFQEY